MKEGEKKNCFTGVNVNEFKCQSHLVPKLSENTGGGLTLVQLKKKHASHFFLCFLSFSP